MCLCSAGEGDCDIDADCEGALVCGQDNGPLYGQAAGLDLCWGDHCDDGTQNGNETGTDCGGDCPSCCQYPNWHWSHCNPTRCVCGAGEGDCDTDNDCQGSLVCEQNVGALWGQNGGMDVCQGDHCMNGVQDGDEAGIDCGGSCTSCNCPYSLWDWSYCNVHPDCGVCDAGEGDCDVDDDCRGTLVCGQDRGYLWGQDGGMDVCEGALCQNQTQDPGEDGVDCGGDCPPCPN